MAILPITKKQLLKEYNKQIDQICDDLDWKTSFSGQEICSIIFGIMINHKLKTTLTGPKLHNAYNKHVKALNISDEEWRKTYKIPQIVEIIYDLLEEKA